MKIHTVKKARKDYSEFGVKKGDSYVYCFPKSFRKSGNRKLIRKTVEEIRIWIKEYANSKRGEYSSLVEEVTNFLSEPNFEDIDGMIERVDEMYEEKTQNLENIPHQLQENHILNEQIESLEQLKEELEQLKEEMEEDDES